jgi:hypothetical protein
LAPATYAGTIYVKNSTTTCESAGAAISLVVNANPTASAGDAPAAQCLDEAGNTFQLDGSGTNGTFKWTVQSKSDAAMGVEFSDDAIAKPTVTVTGGVYGTVTLRLTVTSNATPSCGSQYSDVTVTINDLPTPPDVTYNAPACNSAFFSVTVNSPEVGTYILSRTGYDDIKIVSDGTNEVLFENLAAGSGYSVVYENSSKCVSGANNCGGAGLIGKSSSSSLQTTDKAAPTQRSIRTEAYPNPTGRDATINFSVPRSGHVKVDVYNALGRYVTTLFDGEAKGGESHSVVLKGAQLPTGTYYYKVTTDGKTKTNRISLVK